MHRRPSGVTFSAVVLGIIDLFLLLGGLVYALMAFLFARSPQLTLGAANNGAAPPPQHLIVGMMGFFALVTLICAAWGICTFAGLLRMRNWARISIMIIGGCLAALSLLELFGCIIVQLTMKNMVLPPNAGATNMAAPNPVAMQGVFFFMDALCLGIAAIGIWWLVYFARRATRAAFESTGLQATLHGNAQLNPATPITDFSIAQPIEAVQTVAELPVVHVVPVAPGRPISMTIIAVLMFLGSLSMLFCCLLPFPLFMLGIQINGWAAHFVLVFLAVLYGLAGFGLLQRLQFGWILAVSAQLLGLLNFGIMLSPQVRERWLAYMQTVSQSTMPTAANAATASAQIMQQKMMTMLMVPSFILGVAYSVFILVLLWRARWAYRGSE